MDVELDQRIYQRSASIISTMRHLKTLNDTIYHARDISKDIRSSVNTLDSELIKKSNDARDLQKRREACSTALDIVFSVIMFNDR